ncbi:TPA: BppU family phage baseplate upper protein [Enterococcus faecium]|uniref:BppU family phage baseplate upper protein n=1 Tax=Enterococcus lactis TaxID=357441 RepID=UPI0018A89639|nr:BppU family phage baseplate upper protein [Enterococcus lactis]
MADRKVGEITVPTEPVSRATKITGFTFKSYDKNAGVLQFNIENQDGSPTDLIDATVRLFMYIYQGEEKKEFPIFDNQIITESYMQGIVKYRIPDMLLSYEGKVDANVYIDFPDGSHTDNLAFTFTIEKSIIDDNVQLNGEYYFKDFQQLLDGVKQEATDAVNAALTNIDTVSQNVTSAQNNLKAVEDKMNQTNQQIGDLGKLKKMYSNSIDFGDYDYSGNPNLSAKLNASSFSSGTGATVADDGDEIVFTLDGTNQLSKYATRAQTAVIEGKQYTISCEIMLETGFTGDPSGIRLQHAYLPGGNVVLQTATVPKNELNKWQKLIGTQTVKYTSDAPNEWYPLFRDIRNLKPTGKVRLRKIKIEEGPTATPYQPNLLDAPYYLSKVALGENIKNKGTVFPIKTSAYAVYTGPNTEPYIAGQKYTLTMKATKPATQTFNVFLDAGTIGVGSMTPVDGLTDVWQKTFTVSQSNIDAGVKDRLTIYQVPNSSVGAVQIDWLKIEKGDTRTPNISQFKYFGEGLKDSNNPNDYSWDITPEYTEKGLNDSVSLTEPQSVEGLKNFEDGLQIAGKEVATIANSTGWIALTLVDGFEVAENNPPQYKITYQANGDNEIEFRGEFQLTGGTKFTKDTSYYPFGRANQATNIPNELKPDRTAFGYGATSTGVGGRLAVTTMPTFVFIPGDSDGTYCSISPLRYTQTKK